MAKRILLPILLALSLKAFPQLNNRPITNYTPREYGQSYSSYTMSITRDERGIIYVGTAYGILQFDGATWQFIPVRVGSFVTSLSYAYGKIFVGCQGDFGYLEPNELGKFQYKSLRDKVPPYHQNFSTVWKVLPFENTIAFQAEEGLFLFKKDTIESVFPKTSFHLAFVANDTLYVREREEGLKRITGSKVEDVAGGDAFKLYGIFQILPLESGKNLVITREAGFWLLENGRLKKISIPKQTHELLLRADVHDAIITENGEIAITTLKEGVFVLDEHFKVINQYSLQNGLNSSETIGLVEDIQGNIWVATKNGVSRIQHSYPISIFNQSHGLYGKVQAVTQFEGKILAGTTDDLFVYQPDGIKHFQVFGTIRSSIWGFASSGSKLWIAADNGLWVFEHGRLRQVSLAQASAVAYVPEKDWVVISGINGTHIYRVATELAVLSFPRLNPDAYGISYSILPNGILELWLGTKTNGVWELLFDNENLTNQEHYFGIEDGLNEEWTWPFRVNGQVHFGSSLGILRFLTADELFTTEESSTIPQELLKGFFTFSEFPKDKNDQAVTAYTQNDSIAFVGMDYRINVIPFADSLINAQPFKSVELGRFNSFEVAHEQLLVGADEGLALINIPKSMMRRVPIPTLGLRQVVAGQNTVIWYGDVEKSTKFILPYELNTIDIYLASTHIDHNTNAKYFWRQEGSQSESFKESSNGVITLSDLWEGSYTIVAYAENIQGGKSEPISITFRIMPPWYRTLWAYVIYLFMLISAILSIIRMYTQRLRVQKKQLEDLVAHRTREVVEQKEQIQIQKERIEEILTDIQASIAYAQRIQQAILPSTLLIEDMFPKHFMIFYPRDIVSGDFYWAMKVDDMAILTVADCTGHGVPGAFMSMLGISLLNELVGRLNITSPALILNALRDGVIQALKQTDDWEGQKDGMDMSLFTLNLKTLECQWAGANNPLLIFRPKSNDTPFKISESNKLKSTDHESGTLFEIKHNRMPVAIHNNIRPFTNHTFQLYKGDRLFLFTDGFADQFGGLEHMKFMAKNFKNLLGDSSANSIENQGQHIIKTFDEWVTPTGERIKQLDDVTLVGIEM